MPVVPSPSRRLVAPRPRGRVERWTADIERRISAETRGVRRAHEKRFARVPWREIPTRTRALEGHEFVKVTAYVVRASDAFVHPGHFLDKAGVLEADRVVREAARRAREAATRALVRRADRARTRVCGARLQRARDPLARRADTRASWRISCVRASATRSRRAPHRSLGRVPTVGRARPAVGRAARFALKNAPDAPRGGDVRAAPFTTNAVTNAVTNARRGRTCAEAHPSLGARAICDDERRRTETASRRDFTTASPPAAPRL